MKNKNILFKTTHPNIDISVLVYSLSAGKLTSILKYLPKNMALIFQKLRREKKCQNPFPAILRQKQSSFIH